MAPVKDNIVVSATKEHYEEIRNIDDFDIAAEGEKAFYAGIEPDHCPYPES